MTPRELVEACRTPKHAERIVPKEDVNIGESIVHRIVIQSITLPSPTSGSWFIKLFWGRNSKNENQSANFLFWMQKEQKEDNNKTIYPTPVFEEVLSRLDSHNVAGGPPVPGGPPGENRSSVGKDTVKRNRSNNDWENRDNGKPWKSRIALRLKFPDVILPKAELPSLFHLHKSFEDLVD